MIRLYSTGCPNCNILKKMIENKEISYIEETDVNKIISLGITEVPAIMLENKKILNYQEAKKWLSSMEG